jgi:hypothetical protein
MDIFHFSIKVYVNSYTAAVIAHSHYLICDCMRKKDFICIYILCTVYSTTHTVCRRTMNTDVDTVLTYVSVD